MTEQKIREQSEPKIESVAKQNKPQAVITESFALLRLLTMFVQVIKEKIYKSSFKFQSYNCVHSDCSLQ